MKADRYILHVDMDAFFAAVEQRDRPELRGKPVLVGGTGPRGVVSTASYEARVFGCHSAQPMSVARRRCPEAIVLRTDGRKYRKVSARLFELFHEVTPIVEPLSVDEAFLDVTGCERLLGGPVEIARALKRRIVEDLRLTASVGVAANKFLAKLASDLEKPDGLTVIGPDDVARVLTPLPIDRLWGVGPRTAERLRAEGVHTIGDLRALDHDELEVRFGSSGEHFHRLSHGIDAREVTPDGRARSISQECTFPVDVDLADHVRDVLRGHTQHVARRLRLGGHLARTVTVKIRYGDFETITRSATIDRATNDTSPLLDAATALFDRWARRSFQPVRLIGMAASGLEEPGDEQLELFGGDGRRRGRRLDRALDAIQDRFGGAAIRRGGAAGTIPGRQDGEGREPTSPGP